MIPDPRETDICYLCQRELGPIYDHSDRHRIRVHLDHVIPLSRGGTGDDYNLRYVHKRCNLRKGTRTPKEAAHLFGVRCPG